MKTDYSRIMGFAPIAPTPDTDALAETGPRLILIIGKTARGGIAEGNETSDNTLAVVPRGMLSAGWVVGVVTARAWPTEKELQAEAAALEAAR